MATNNENLKSFVKENWNRIKKQKKSPKNFWVDLDKDHKYTLTKFVIDVNNPSHMNLDELYTNSLLSLVADVPTILKEEEINTNKYNVYLSNCNGNKLGVVKEVKITTGLGLKEAKELVDNAPTIVFSNTSKELAEQLVRRITEIGGSASIATSELSKLEEFQFLPKIEFNFRWIGFIIPALIEIIKVDDSMVWNYDEMDENWQSLISKEDFNNLVNYSKQ